MAVGDLLRLPPQAARETSESRSATDRRAGGLGPDPRLVESLRAAILLDQGPLLAFDKPAGLAVQGGSKTTRHVDGALPAFAGEAGEIPRLVHRLDRDTSGVLVTGRGREAAAALTRAFADREARKTYFALVASWPEGQEAGVIDAPLRKGRVGGEERVFVDSEGHEDAQRRALGQRVDQRRRTFAQTGAQLRGEAAVQRL
ncbi:MAG: pseudouridine synthase, partial [Alphaproteobacteria bacterium]